MKIDGKVVHILEEQGGEGRRGPWRKQDFVVEIPGEYPKPVCCTMWGENIDNFALQVGDDVSVSIDIKSREYNGRWYTDVTAWRLDKRGAVAAPSSPPARMSDPDDDLPF